MFKSKIDWCDSSYNPISGCYHTCEYCYARGIATRFGGCNAAPNGETVNKLVVLKEPMKITDSKGKTRDAAYPFGFTPTLHEYRLDHPKRRGFGKTVFVGSMSDIFGEWVPDEWIEKVFNSCMEAPNHRYLFLTKNPKRYLELAEKGKLPELDNFWYGSTATTQETQVFHSSSHHTFVSIEPILEPFTEGGDLAELVDWAIFGAETGTRKGKVIPERSWFEYAVCKFEEAGKPVFMKESLTDIWGEPLIQEYPWED